MRLDVKIKKIPCEEGLFTIFALVAEDSREMDTFDMLPKIATVASYLATY